jgi:hypothetical protein
MSFVTWLASRQANIEATLVTATSTWRLLMELHSWSRLPVFDWSYSERVLVVLGASVKEASGFWKLTIATNLLT